jgi:hypothetical protein
MTDENDMMMESEISEEGQTKPISELEITLKERMGKSNYF